MNILLGVTGSVAAIKTPSLVTGLQSLGDVQIVATNPGHEFFDADALRHRGLSPVPVRTESEEWSWRKLEDPILHIELRNWLDVLVIAPLSANTLGKMANGICDNLLLSVWLANACKPVVVAPAMNTQMWDHPLVQRNLETLRSLGTSIVDPVEKKLACGDTGVGAMANITDIVAEVKRRAGLCVL